MDTISLLTREEFLAQMPTLSVQAVAALDQDSQDIACDVCREDLVDTLVNDYDEHAVLLHDKHAFGERCAREWLAENNTCPTCRHILFQADEESDDDDKDDDTLEDLLSQAVELSDNESDRVVPDDREIMELWFHILHVCQAEINADVHGLWAMNSQNFTAVEETMETLLEGRLQWYLQSPQEVNINITQPFDYPAWQVSADDLTKLVRIDFDCSLQSAFRRELQNQFVQAFDENFVCTRTAGHPMAYALLDLVDEVLEECAGRSISVRALKYKLMRKIVNPDCANPDAEERAGSPAGFPAFVRYLIDLTCQRAISRTDRSAATPVARAARRESTCPRMSAPSTRDL